MLLSSQMENKHNFKNTRVKTIQTTFHIASKNGLKCHVFLNPGFRTNPYCEMTISYTSSDNQNRSLSRHLNIHYSQNSSNFKKSVPSIKSSKWSKNIIHGKMKKVLNWWTLYSQIITWIKQQIDMWAEAIEDECMVPKGRNQAESLEWWDNDAYIWESRDTTHWRVKGNAKHPLHTHSRIEILCKERFYNCLAHSRLHYHVYCFT